MNSLNKLGVSYYDKLYLEFDNVFWDDNIDFYYLISDDWVYILNCYKHCTKKPILCFFSSGKSSLRMSTMSDEEVI